MTYKQPTAPPRVVVAQFHRKHASLLSRVRGRRERLHRAARHASWWIGILFAVGSICFMVAPMPWFFDLAGPQVDAAVFFVGSVFFTSAAALQWLETINADPGPAERRTRSSC